MRENQLEQAMDKYTQYLFRIGYYYTKDLERAKDLAQDVFIQFYYSNYQEQGQLKAYLSRLMINRCKDYLKSWSYRKLVLQQAFTKEPVVNWKDSVVLEEQQALLDEAILGLKVKLREVIVYYYLEQMTTKEIAALLNCPESTIKTRLQSARKKLYEQLHAYDWEVLIHE